MYVFFIEMYTHRDILSSMIETRLLRERAFCFALIHNKSRQRYKIYL